MTYSPSPDSIRTDLSRIMPAAIVTDDLVTDVLTAVVAHREAREAKREAHREKVIVDILARPFNVARLTKDVADHNRVMLEQALRLAFAGFLVIPAHRFDPVAGRTASRKRYNKLARRGEVPDGAWVEGQIKYSKIPVGIRWQQRASRDPEAIWQLFNEYPTAVYKDGKKTGDEVIRPLDFEVNLSIVTGQRAGYFVVDIDKEPALRRWEAFEAQHGPFPDTVRAVSGSGEGWHIFYKLPENTELHNTASRFGSGGKEGTGLDIRAKGGQVICAPSLHKRGGFYEFEPGHSPFDIRMAMGPDAVVEEAVRCSKVAQREQTERDGSAPEKRAQDDDPEDVDADFIAVSSLPSGPLNRVAQIGYGPGTAECIHYAVLSAVLSLFWQRGYMADTTILEASIRERIAVAVAGRPDKADRYTDNAYVPERSKEARQCAKEWGYAERKAWAFESMDDGKETISKATQSDAEFIVERLAVSTTLTPVNLDLLVAQLHPLMPGVKVSSIMATIRGYRKDKKKGGSVLDPIVEEFNRDYVVYEGPTKVEVLQLRRPPGVLPPQYDHANFIKLTESRRVVGEKPNGTEIRAGDVWFDSAERKVVTAIGFAPPGAKPLPFGTFNLWNGFPHLKSMSAKTDEELQGMSRLFLAHLLDNICDGDVKGYNWFLDFWADIFQCPGHKPGTSVVIVSGQGGGKTTVHEMLFPAFGPYMHKHNSEKQKNATHNDGDACKLVIVIEEVTWSGNASVANQDKDDTTSERKTFNPKFRSAFTINDFSRRLTFANNVTKSQAISKGDRRSTVFRVNPKMEEWRKKDEETGGKGHQAYFTAIRLEMEGDGLPAFVELMNRRVYSVTTLRNPYETAAKRVMLRAQADPGVSYVVESADLGEFSSAARDPDDATVILEPVKFDHVVQSRSGEKWVALPLGKLMAHFRDTMQRSPNRYASADYMTSRGVHALLVELVGAKPERGVMDIDGVSTRVIYVPELDMIHDRLIADGYLEDGLLEQMEEADNPLRP